MIVVVFLAYFLLDFFFEKKLVGENKIFPDWIMFWDSKILLLVNRELASPFLDIVFAGLTHIGLTYFWLALAIFLWFKKMREEAVLLTLTIVLSSLIVLPAKFFLPRARPFLLLDLRTLWFEGGYSFPSGHAKNSFASAKILGNKKKKLKIFLYILAVAVSFSRIYLGFHWPTDVLAGALVGWFSSSLILCFRRKIMSVF